MTPSSRIERSVVCDEASECLGTCILCLHSYRIQFGGDDFRYSLRRHPAPVDGLGGKESVYALYEGIPSPSMENSCWLNDDPFAKMDYRRKPNVLFIGVPLSSS